MKKFFAWLKKHTILYHLAMIALLFVGVAVVSFLVMMFGTRHGVSRTVPDFKGLRLADAEYYASRRGLHIVVNDSLFVPAYEGGIVLDQLPKGGVSVKPGRKVYVPINSFCQPQVPVPYVAGRSLRQAKNMLEAAGLTIAELEYVEDIATNYVLAEFLDGVEVFNMHPGHNSRIGLAALYANENKGPIITAGADFHHPKLNHEGLSALRTENLPEDSFALAKLLRSQDYVLELGRGTIVLP